ncbi:MAG: class I SAM-dependent methyltransferase [Deltaproteobacteria bacterium]|nr:class I SAM-dependent methyltransferase [Candidatus Zymogenaceae bacterium]
MKENCPSATALSVAVRRAGHQLTDGHRIFDDPLALRILGVADGSNPDPGAHDRSSFSRGLRPFLAARSRYTEDEMHAAVGRGVGQYVVLGAGLDTFAYRSPYPGETLHVFEVDHPATQQWKRECLSEAGISIPPALTFAPVDFETETLGDGLCRAGFDTGAPAFFSWLGVTQYLTEDAVAATLGFVATLAAGSSIVFDYTIDPSSLMPAARAAFDFLTARTAQTGEPFRSFFTPTALIDSLEKMGFGQCRDVLPEDLNALYFQGRPDKLSTNGFTHMMNARV